jgi:hypothetical protein
MPNEELSSSENRLEKISGGQQYIVAREDSADVTPLSNVAASRDPLLKNANEYWFILGSRAGISKLTMHPAAVEAAAHLLALSGAVQLPKAASARLAAAADREWAISIRRGQSTRKNQRTMRAEGRGG